MAARRLAVALNLFSNFAVDLRHFRGLEVAYTYVYMIGFSAAVTVLGLNFFQSSHLSYHCQGAPRRADMCPTDFIMCSCPDQLLTRACNMTRDLADCTCCWYGEIELRSGVLLFMTHVGGLYTFSMGTSLVVLALARRCMGDRAEQHAPSIQLNEASRDRVVDV